MDEYFQSILTSLRKPQNGKRVLQVLIALRKQINGGASGCRNKIELMRTQNCLKPLIGYTQYEANVKVVDLALSILGNCCTVTSVIQEMINDLNVLHNLNRVLERHDKDSIKGRVFRILGNLCDGYERIKFIEKEPKLIENVLKFLKDYEQDEDVSLATISMALRFIRKIIAQSTFELLNDDYQMVKVIGLVFIKCAQCWLIDNQKDLLNDILKILQIITSSCYTSRDVVEELKTTDNGNALELLGDIIMYDPERIVKVILKLAKISRHQSDLPIDTIIKRLLAAIDLQQANEDAKRSHRDYLACMNRLMDHIAFHDKLKNANTILILIHLLRDLRVVDDCDVHCCINICSILNKCKFNECLVRAQLNGDIVRIVLAKLQTITGKSCDVLQVKKKKGHDRNRTPYSHHYRNVKRQKTTNNIIFDDNFYEFDNDINRANEQQRCVSPSSCSDVSSTGPFSPLPPSKNSNHLISDDSDSDNYSPLCSENECDDDFKESIPDDDAVLSDTEEKRTNFNQGQIELRRRLRDEMIALLKYYTTMRPMCQQLGDTKLIILLMNIVFDSTTTTTTNCDLTTKTENVLSLLLAITQSREFLIPLMLSGCISHIYDLKDDTKQQQQQEQEDDCSCCCADCKQVRKRADAILANLVCVGESESIKGDLAYILLGKAHVDTKNKLALAIPYVIRSNSALMKLLIDCGGLSILLNLLKDQSNPTMLNRSIKSLCTLASVSLRIKNPVNKKLLRLKTTTTTIMNQVQSSQIKMRVGCYAFPRQCDNIVTFRLDDGECVKADRDALNEKSDYFRALLSNGHFLESEQKEIALRNVASDSLNCLLQLLHLNVKLGDVLQFDYAFTTILDVILLSDRFLLSDLNYLLICHIEQLLSTHTVPILYKWAIESCTNIMRIESVAYALVADITFNERLTMFHSLFKLGYHCELIDDIEKLITQFF